MAQQRLAIFRAPQGLVRDDEAREGSPWVDAEAPLLAPTAHEVPVVDLEPDPEPLLHFRAPLERQSGRADDQGLVHTLAQRQFLQDEAGLDRLAQPDVVGQEQVHARQFQGLAQRHQLVVEQLDPCAEGRLEEARIRGGHAAPLERVQIGGEVARWIEAVGPAQPMRLGLDHPRAQLTLPQDFQAAPGGVVIKADQADQRLP